MATRIYELPFASYEVARSLFDPAWFDRAHIDAAFAGRQPSRLFVDDPRRPTGAILCRTYEYFLAGQPAPALRQFVAEAPAEARIFDVIHDLDRARRESTIAFYGLVPVGDLWREALIEEFDGALEQIGRRTFRFDGALEQVSALVARIPPGFSVRAVDAALAERIDREVNEFIGLFWGGYERFGLGGTGACVVDGERIASVAYAIAVSDREMNIGVETVADYRRRGLATIASRACMAEALARGITPTWDCDDSNPASAALALRLGFTELPSFLELALPGRAGPALSMGRWIAEGGMWRRIED
jgi:RimJ/RimL family protein N-acetyltransferase